MKRLRLTQIQLHQPLESLEQRVCPSVTFVEQLSLSCGTNNLVGLHAADVDGDKHVDLLVAHESGIAWCRSLGGTGMFGDARALARTFANPGLIVGDLNDDGKLDVLGSTGTDVIWFPSLDGAGAFGDPRIIGKDAGHAVHLHAIDLDDDGDLDVLSSSIGQGSSLRWYENVDGQGSFGDPQLIDHVPFGTTSVSIVDIDGDKDLDVLAVSAYGGQLLWYENRDGRGDFGVSRSVPLEGEVFVRAMFAADVESGRY